MSEREEKQRTIDDEHLKLLSLFHYISGGLTLALALFIGAYFLVIFFIFSSTGFQREISPGTDFQLTETMLTILLTMMILVFILGMLFGVAQIISGRLIKSRKLRWFSFTIGIINLISIPYGTILGIMTLIVLGRDSILKQYSMTTD